MIYQYRALIKTLMLGPPKDVPGGVFSKMKTKDSYVYNYYERHFEAAHDLVVGDEVRIGDVSEKVRSRTFVVDITNSEGGVMSLWLGTQYSPGLTAAMSWEPFDPTISERAVKALLDAGFVRRPGNSTDYWDK